ncbi:thiol reductant ABC exporter subunit CydD [Tamilnaduibacter salinus]|uniref:Thiol reductant ABC exporter subunit CydD n=1 Tax=Tamilnaduibacter salinus TaxID=1484056 RepID=A0A2A2I4V7_9GAMM|nr:thiol reductant ABC exporter subunit CydD [Tamilnaduibacter salinus]
MLRRLCEGSRGLVHLSVVAGALSTVALVVQLGLVAWIVDQVVMRGQPIAHQGPPLAGVALAIAIRAVAQLARDWIAVRASDRVRDDVRRELLSRWATLGPVATNDSPAARASAWDDQVEALHGHIAHYVPQSRLSVLSPLLIVGVVMTLDAVAGTFLLFAAPLIPLFMALVGMGAERYNQQHFETLAHLSGHFLDRMRAMTTLQLFGHIGATRRDIARRTDDYRRITMKTLRIAFLSSAVLEFFAAVSIAVIAMYVGFALLGSLSVGPAKDLTLFSGLFILLLAPEFFQPLRQLALHYHDRAAALGAAANLERHLSVALPVPTTPPEAIQPDRIADGIELRRLSLGFPGKAMVLDGVDLTVAKGECLVLTGASGAGKSSLLHLIAGFRQPDAGEVRVFGNPPGTQPFGWLGQHPYLMQGSWADNLRLVCPKASDDDIEAALTRAGLGALVAERPAGIHSPLSETGVGLSGGQARRLALARTFLADYPLVLLDEPTAALDRETEVLVLDAIQRLIDGRRTIIIASHHPEVLTLASRVLAIEDGEVRDA